MKKLLTTTALLAMLIVALSGCKNDIEIVQKWTAILKITDVLNEVVRPNIFLDGLDEPLDYDISDEGYVVLELEADQYLISIGGHNYIDQEYTVFKQGVSDTINVQLGYIDGKILNFLVYDQSSRERLEGATIKLGNAQKSTNEDGFASFENIPKDDYHYSISNFGYIESEGNIEIIEDDEDLPVGLVQGKIFKFEQKDVHLTTYGSPYVVYENITVGVDSSLTIDQCVELRFAEGIELFVDGGDLILNSTEGCPVNFTSINKDEKWGGINLLDVNPNEGNFFRLENFKVSNMSKNFGVFYLGDTVTNIILNNFEIANGRGFNSRISNSSLKMTNGIVRDLSFFTYRGSSTLMQDIYFENIAHINLYTESDIRYSTFISSPLWLLLLPSCHIDNSEFLYSPYTGIIAWGATPSMEIFRSNITYSNQEGVLFGVAGNPFSGEAKINRCYIAYNSGLDSVDLSIDSNFSSQINVEDPQANITIFDPRELPNVSIGSRWQGF